MTLNLPKIIGHRCSRQEGVYENTFNAMNSVLEHIDGIEIDVVLSKDKHLFFIHDTLFMGDHVDYELGIRLSEESLRIANGRRIDEMNADEINNLILVDGQKLFNLDSFLSLIPKVPANFFINFELKSMETFLPLAEIVYQQIDQAHITLTQILFSSFNHEELSIGIQKYPNIPIGILFEPSNTKGCPMYPWITEGLNYGNYIPYNKDYLAQQNIKALNPAYICLNVFDLRPEVLNDIEAVFPDVPTLIWWYYPECSPSENNSLSNTLKNLHQQGMLNRVAGIITDFPMAMKKEIKEWF